MDGRSLTPQQEKLKQLKELLPEAFTENKVDWEKLKATLGEDINFANERYVLNWAGKSEAFKALQTPSTKTLIPAKDESINFDETENIFIEGENLEVLKVLQKSYFGKVKMIYIDPPYNTGNDSFIYPDSFSETIAEYQKRVGDKNEEGYMTKQGMFHKNSKEGGQYHSNWLNMMYPRLFLARNLLKEDGVMFVSIDDHEVHNLRSLMNEIFGEDNFIASIIWEKKFSPQNDAKWFSDNHDYILVISKNKNLWHPNKFPRTNATDSRFKNPDNDERGDWASSDLTVKSYNAKYDFPITTPGGRVVNPTGGRCWSVSEKKFGELVKDKRIWFGKAGNGVPRYKSFLSEIEDGIVPLTIWKHDVAGHNQEGRQELKSLFNGKGYFDGPKPIRLLKRILHLSSSSTDIILDFFSGSASTAHAVMAMNIEDGGARKHISVQLPELCDKASEAYKAKYKTIADIAKDRIRKVSSLLKKENPKYKGDLGFKVLKLSDSNFKQWKQIVGKDAKALEEQMKLFVDPVSEKSSTVNMVYELLLKSGKDINSKLEDKKDYYTVNGDEMVLLLSKVSKAIIDKVLKEHPKKVIALDKLFKDNDQLKTNTSLQMKDARIEFKTI